MSDLSVKYIIIFKWNGIGPRRPDDDRRRPRLDDNVLNADNARMPLVNSMNRGSRAHGHDKARSST